MGRESLMIGLFSRNDSGFKPSGPRDRKPRRLAGAPHDLRVLYGVPAVCLAGRIPFHHRFHHLSPVNSAAVRSVLPPSVCRSALLSAVSNTIDPRTSTPGETKALAATTA